VADLPKMSEPGETVSAADAESHLREFIRDVVRLREAD
jgi:hypothetical protein